MLLALAGVLALGGVVIGADPATAAGPRRRLVHPADVFGNFAAVRFSMTFAAARATLEKSGLHPASLRSLETELAWDGTFDGSAGRGILLLKPGPACARSRSRARRRNAPQSSTGSTLRTVKYERAATISDRDSVRGCGRLRPLDS